MAPADTDRMLDQIYDTAAHIVAAVVQAAPRASLSVLKLVVFALVLVNARFWPLIWHCPSLCLTLSPPY